MPSPVTSYIVRKGAAKAKDTTVRLIKYKNPNVRTLRAVQRGSAVKTRGNAAGSTTRNASLRLAGARHGWARSRADRMYNKAAYRDSRTSVLARQRGKNFRSPSVSRANSSAVGFRLKTSAPVSAVRGVRYGVGVTKGNNVVYRAYVLPKAVGRGARAGYARGRSDRATARANARMKAAHRKVYRRNRRTLRDSHGRFAGSAKG